MARKIVAREIVADIRAGMSRSDLMRKYSLSEGQLKLVFRKIAQERRARAEALASDLRKGTSEKELIAKYELSEQGLETISKVLLEEGFLASVDKDKATPEPYDDFMLELRRSPRYRPLMPVTVCDTSDRRSRFFLKDISEHGLSVIGLRAMVNEIRRLAILGDEFGEVVPFEFEARCRWAARVGPEDQLETGFQLVNISDENRARLHHLIERFSLPTDMR